MTTNKYGNDFCWCFIEDKLLDNKEVAIWRDNKTGDPYIICRAIDKYEAKKIVDALLAFNNTTKGMVLDKKEIIFLEFVKSTCKEPYATMASNAILWDDREAYKKLLSDFSVLY